MGDGFVLDEHQITQDAAAPAAAPVPHRFDSADQLLRICAANGSMKTMRDTGADMMDKYKETARGRLALNVVEY